jgi:uncharacterized membrane protein
MTFLNEYKVKDGVAEVLAMETMSAMPIEGQPCHDSMSRVSFDTTVTVILDDKKYRGCGKALHSIRYLYPSHQRFRIEGKETVFQD